MPAGSYDFHVEQGISTTFHVEYKDPVSNPKDLTGYLGRGSIKENMGSVKILAEMVITITEPLAGKIRITLPATALQNACIKGTSHKDKMKAVYDIELYKEGVVDSEIRLLNGTVFISPEVTK
jgi:hypothetical protein